MCRHAAWLGGPRTLQELLIDPPYGLVRQSWSPRFQRYGTVNADGFGVGWFCPERVEPARYRCTSPLWADSSFASLAGVVRTGCMLAAVRSATLGGPGGEEACAPFLLPGGVLLSHNGAVPVASVAPMVSATSLAAIGSTVDSAFVAALVAERLAAGEALPGALGSAVLAVAAVAPEARLNLLATDGVRVAATAWGDTLSWRRESAGVVVASEPSDDGPGWEGVADRCVLVVDPDLHVSLRPLENGCP